CKKRGIE
ncbi:hypothetical protein A2U01_0103633, partial [Trifolium medium]|nr:hypothetical protein [Trifolium medium]